MSHSVLAQATMEIPMSDTLKTLVGLIGVMVLIITVLTCVILVKKVFGRTPPLTDELKKLRSEIYKETGGVRKDLTLRMDGVDAEIEEIKIDRERKWKELTGEYHKLDTKIATLTERITNVLSRL